MKLNKIVIWSFCLMWLSSNVFANKEYCPLMPFWQTNQMQGECLLFVKEDGHKPAAKLLFKADQICKVYQPCTGIVFEEGVDYTYKQGQNQIFLTEDSRIPFKLKSDLYKTPSSPMSIKGCRDGVHDLFFAEGFAQTILSLLVCDTQALKNAVEKVISPSRSSDVKTIELLKDRHFRKGFNVLDPKHGKKIVRGKLALDTNLEPDWFLAQWHSKFDILKVDCQKLQDGGVLYENVAKKIILQPKDADVVLGLNSIPEYNNKLRKGNEPWPHLLVEQNIVVGCPALSDLKGLDFRISAKLLQSETITGDGYSKGLHTGHMPFVLVVQNVNPKSSGFNDFMWFLVPIYDDRYEFPQEFIAEDIADPSAKMIYDPGGRRYYSEPLTLGKSLNLTYDLLPVIIEALNVAWERGYLQDSYDLSDYGIVSMNLGWEVTGLNKVEMAIKDLSLKAVISK